MMDDITHIPLDQVIDKLTAIGYGVGAVIVGMGGFVAFIMRWMMARVDAGQLKLAEAVDSSTKMAELLERRLEEDAAKHSAIIEQLNSDRARHEQLVQLNSKVLTLIENLYMNCRAHEERLREERAEREALRRERDEARRMKGGSE
jgi:hypothetical protein